jgi:putative adhesin
MTTTTLPASRRPPVTPAQRVILVLGVPLVLTVAAWSGYGILAATGHSSYTVTSSAPLSGGQLTMNAGDVWDGAGISVQGGAATGSVRLSGTIGYDLNRPDVRPQLNVSRGPGGSSVGFSCPAENCQLEAAASVPSATAVSVTGNGNSVSVDGIAAPVSASTGGGDLTLNALTGGSLALSTDGGNVQGTALSVPDVTVDSGFGDVDLMLTTVPKSLEVNSGGGNVTIELPPGATRYRLQLDGGCGNPDGGNSSAVPSSAGSGPGSWCQDVSSSVPDDASSQNVIVVSSGGGQITIT